jgi:hypothetical protein
MCSCISLERGVLIPNLQHLRKVYGQEAGDGAMLFVLIDMP